jgi:hypothetical protein
VLGLGYMGDVQEEAELTVSLCFWLVQMLIVGWHPGSVAIFLENAD